MEDIKGLTSENSLAEIIKLYNMCFQANAILDRIVYELDLRFNLVKFQEYMHENISHLFPQLADEIEGFGRKRGDEFFRDASEIANKSYENASDAIKDFIDIMAELEMQNDKAIDTCIENKDKGYEDFLRSFGVNRIIPLQRQAVIFYRGIKDYETNGNLAKWNNVFENYIDKTWNFDKEDGD